MKKSEIIARTEELVTPIIQDNNFELVDVEYVKEGADWHLQIFADKEGGINIDDCVFISRALEKKLDEEDFIQDAYILEVSSPGLGRPLKKNKDFDRNIGKKVELKLFKAVTFFGFGFDFGFGLDGDFLIVRFGVVLRDSSNLFESASYLFFSSSNVFCNELFILA